MMLAPYTRSASATFCQLLSSCPSRRRKFIVGGTYPADNVRFHCFLAARAEVCYGETRDGLTGASLMRPSGSALCEGRAMALPASSQLPLRWPLEGRLLLYTPSASATFCQLRSSCPYSRRK